MRPSLGIMSGPFALRSQPFALLGHVVFGLFGLPMWRVLDHSPPTSEHPFRDDEHDEENKECALSASVRFLPFRKSDAFVFHCRWIVGHIFNNLAQAAMQAEGAARADRELF